MLMSSSERLAVLRYEANGFRVIAPGTHVKCAVTGEPIQLEVLRYWSVEHQEAYATCTVATKRLAEVD
ncbi:DUF2093 domain-containing protein [Novosphingobium sp. TH158]|uniref:DUF2093 domain-containing protein n=1 Tax=Novosphingobium sp. TH158 TaxID=2067455 RepID=UPI000C7BB173|nr:DUF2093 domain-containing protein [Novosphingobium sp. TH158]PLK27264.1 DUF2093 domain-containing protein [Novosphingobium sp. TH158]